MTAKRQRRARRRKPATDSDINAEALRMLRPGPTDSTTWRDVMTVDPGLGGTGVAFWRKLVRGTATEPDFVDVLHEEDETATWTERARSIARAARELLPVPETLFVEVPRLWPHSRKSRAAAIRGDLTKLSAVAGMVIEAVSASRFATLRVVTAFPRDWKDQLPKDAVVRRIYRALGLNSDGLSYPDHAADAVGMGLAIAGVL
jgi:hypothetical protein